MTMKNLHALALVGALALAVALSACATVNPYHPAARPGGYGYSEQRLETDRFRISFQGDTATKRPEVENYLLFRSAEVTLQSGYDYFVVTNRANETDRRTDPVYGGTYGGPFLFPYSYYSPRWGWRSYYDPFWANPVHYAEVTRYQASAEILMGKGAKPAGDAHAFDARQVQANLQAKVFPPPK
jgi:hypothetical protein